MSASDNAPDNGPTDAELQALVDGMAEFADKTGETVRDVLAERPTSSEADGPTFAHLSDVTVTRAEMNRIADADTPWTTVSVKGGIGWHNTDTGEVVYEKEDG